MLNRRVASLTLLFIISLAATPRAQSGDDIPNRDDYAKFVRPYFVGTWRSEATKGDGAVATSGVIEFQMAEKQSCAISVSSSETGTLVDTAIHGYDPGAKCWRVVQFSEDGSMVSMEVHIDKKTLTSGKYDGVTYKHRNTVTKPDGTREVSDWKAVIVDRNTFELQQLAGATTGPVKVRFVRK